MSMSHELPLLPFELHTNRKWVQKFDLPHQHSTQPLQLRRRAPTVFFQCELSWAKLSQSRQEIRHCVGFARLIKIAEGT